MKFVRFSKPNHAEGVGVHSGGRVVDLSPSYDAFDDMLADADNVRVPAGGTKVDSSDLLPPVSRTSKILCMAINYHSHIDEQRASQTKEPILFTKFCSSLTGPYAEIPRFTTSEIMDYEGEIAVVIGKRTKNVRRSEAWDRVLGYTLLNDMSARSLFRVPQGNGVMLDWFSCKAMDRSTPVGPWVVTKDEAGDFAHLRIETFLNGLKVQSADPSDMVFDVPKIIEHASSRVTLEPGDIISTGTPAGVGVARKRTLEKGDVVRVQAKGIGHLENRIV
ncbi:MAG: fumarylacetoacetate hydrolase family protein [Nitrososphaerota archaeon]|nr:fumarylacetoacetate hydrolase family protein [Nitrososphaerota archaeon]MDG7024903.1 fumarylacetoacetate hydrolase family protein [Nitrososphaerota archaeon]